MGMLASLTRGPGVLSVVALAWIAWEQWPFGMGWAGIRRAMPVAFGLALPLLGGLAFVGWRQIVGFPPMAEILNKYYAGIVFNQWC